METSAIIYIVVGIVAVVAVFVRSRVRWGAPALKLTDQDRAGLREFCRNFGVRRVFARLLGGLASLGFIAGGLSLFHRQASGGADWSSAVVLTVFSLILLLCAVLLLRSAR